MKKFLAVLLSLILAFSFCVPAFAEESSSQSSIMDTVTEIMSKLQNGEEISPDEMSDLVDQMLEQNPSFANIFASIIKTFDKDSGENTIEAMHKEGYISDSAYEVLKVAYENADVSDMPDMPDVPDTPIAAAIDALLASNPEAASKIINSFSTFEYEDIQKALDKMKADGQLSDSAYATLSNEVKVQASVAASVSESIANSGETTTSPIDGVKSFFGNIVNTVMGLFGMGGNDGGDTTTTTKKASSSNSGTTIPKTGDIALYSVAGIALAAGIALVLTKKKNDSR